MVSTRTLRPEPDTDYTADAVFAWQRLMPDEVDVSALEATLRLRRACILLEEHLRGSLRDVPHLDNFGDYEVLSLLRRRGKPVTPGALAKRLHVTKAGITGRLKRLEAHQLIRMDGDKSDGRKRQVALTGAGRRVADRAFRALHRSQRDFFARLEPIDRHALTDALHRLLVQHEDGPEPD